MCQKTWCLASTVLILAAFGGGVGVGWVWRSKEEPIVAAGPRPDEENPQAKSKPPAPPDGVRLERLKDAESLLDSVFQPNVMLKFSGNKYLKFWAEIETNGRTRQIVEANSRPFFQFPGPIPHDAGEFVWVRQGTGTPGRETWRMVVRAKNATQFANMDVHLFGQAPIKSTQALLPAPIHEVPDPLPLNQPVCLKEVREISEVDDRVQIASNMGLLGSAIWLDPLTRCATVVAPKTAGICTIRLMCRVESDNVVPGK
jgi:hypothetical protein